MAQRTRVRKFESPEIQGEESYIALRLPTRGEVKTALRASRDLARKNEKIGQLEAAGQTEEADRLFEETFAENEKHSADLVLAHLFEWNWVGEDGKQLNLPKSAADIDTMPSPEANFLINAVSKLYQPDPEKEKN